MIYNYVSAKTVIGKVLRDTRVQEVVYTTSILVWLGEFLRQISGTRQLQPVVQRAKLCFHKLPFPEGCMTLTGVAYQNQRLEYRQSEIVPTNHIGPEHAGDVLVFDDTYQPETPLRPGAYEMTWKSLPAYQGNAWYSIEPGWLVCSLKDAWIDIYYRKLYHDKEGYPMIPDNAALHESIYWFVRHKMIGTGWIDPVHGRDDRTCYQRYQEYFDQATGSMDMMTPDMAMALAEQHINPYPDEGKWKSFGTVITPNDLL